MSLTKKELTEKIAKVKEDLAKLRVNGGDDKKTEILTQYIEYLEDELKQATE